MIAETKLTTLAQNRNMHLFFRGIGSTSVEIKQIFCKLIILFITKGMKVLPLKSKIVTTVLQHFIKGELN